MITFINDRKQGSVTVTVTEALVLCSPIEDRGRITESIRILVPIDSMKHATISWSSAALWIHHCNSQVLNDGGKCDSKNQYMHGTNQVFD